MSDDGSFFGGYNLLDGMPLRRAGTILYAIEGRTLQLVAQSKQALNRYLPEKTAVDREKAFLSAIAQGRDLPAQPTIQEIERFAPEWRSLVPADENLRAALAKKISEKYVFCRQDIPAIREALGLDGEGVQQAYQRLVQKPLDTIYAARGSPREALRWLSSRFTDRLERMPPVWTAYSLTLTETVGGSILALPIALAGVGPMAGIVFLVVLGLVNLLTVMGIVEAITRNGNMRYGTAYFGRLVGDFLGRPGSVILVPVLFLLNVIGLLAYYIGISTTLADISGVSPLLWCMLILLVSIYYLRREGLNATVASALVIGIINILILITLSGLSLPYVQVQNLTYINLPYVNGQPFDPGIFELVFGVVLAAFFGHTSAANAAKVVLRRDPGGSALIKGNIAAMLTAIGLYCLWLAAVNGAIPASELSGITGTALAPLGAMIGGVVPVLGVVYVILAMGIGIVYMSYGVYYQVLETLPGSIHKRGQFLAGLVPILLIFLLVEWMLFTGRESFAWLVGALGGILTPLLGGIFPILMLAASRRKGEYAPQRIFAFLGNPLVLALVYLVYLGGVFVYGFLIWDDPLQRLFAIGMGIVVLAVTFLVVRQGAFTSRAVIELRVDMMDNFELATLSLIDRGKPHDATFLLVYPGENQCLSGSSIEIPKIQALQSIALELPCLAAKEIKVWVHRVTQEGNSDALPAVVKIQRERGVEEARLGTSSSSITWPAGPQASGIEIVL